jgi:putative flippase GtrA
VAPLGRAVLRLRESIISKFFRPLRFGVVGLLNTVLGLAVIFVAKAVLGMGDLAANFSGYGIGLICSFLLNRRWTFRHDSRAFAAFWRFAVAFAVAYGLNLATVFGLRDAIGLNSYLAQASGIVPYAISFYLMSAYYVFPAKPAAAPGRPETGD